MKKLLLLCSLFVGTSALVSCSSSDEDPVATSITLTSDVETIDIGSSINLSVKNDLEENVTSTATYYTNGETILNPFTPTVAGTYNIHAVAGDLTSNIVTVNVNAVQEDNALWYNKTNYSLTNSALVYWGGVDMVDDGIDEATHAWWSLLTADGTSDLASQYNSASTRNNFLNIWILNPLVEGAPVYPGTEDVLYYGILEMYLNGVESFDYETNIETEPSFAFGANITGEETAISYNLQTIIDGVSAGIEYDSAFEGIYVAESNGSGDRPVFVKESVSLSQLKSLTALK